MRLPLFAEYLLHEIGRDNSLYLDHNLLTAVPGSQNEVYRLEIKTMNVQNLHLSWGGLHDVDIAILSTCSCSNTSVKELHLDGNHIFVGGAIHLK